MATDEQKLMKNIVKEAEKRGWTVTKTGKSHWKFVSPEGEVTHTGATHSDPRAFKNFKARMERMGFEMRPKKGRPLTEKLNEAGVAIQEMNERIQKIKQRIAQRQERIYARYRGKTREKSRFKKQALESVRIIRRQPGKEVRQISASGHRALSKLAKKAVTSSPEKVQEISKATGTLRAAIKTQEGRLAALAKITKYLGK